MAATVFVLCPVCKKVMERRTDPDAISNNTVTGTEPCATCQSMHTITFVCPECRQPHQKHIFATGAGEKTVIGSEPCDDCQWKARTTGSASPTMP